MWISRFDLTGFYLEKEWRLSQESLCDFNFRSLNGKEIDAKDFEALPEFATICAICNDSSVDYNAVSAELMMMMII